MKLRVISDIHTEGCKFDLPSLPDDKNTVLIIAGDFGVAKQSSAYVKYMEDYSTRFKEVIMLLGNHEHYGVEFLNTEEFLKLEIAHLDNVRILNNETFIHEDVVFIGSTLWTNYLNENPMCLHAAKDLLRDHSVITYDTKAFLPQDALAEFNFSISYIKHALENNRGKKVVVMTHHCPSYRSVHPKFRTGDASLMNGCFYSDLDQFMEDHEDIVYWVHGHTHDNHDYVINESGGRVICNPRGYQSYSSGPENPAFDPRLTLEI